MFDLTVRQAPVQSAGSRAYPQRTAAVVPERLHERLVKPGGHTHLHETQNPLLAGALQFIDTANRSTPDSARIIFEQCCHVILLLLVTKVIRDEHHVSWRRPGVEAIQSF